MELSPNVNKKPCGYYFRSLDKGRNKAIGGRGISWWLFGCITGVSAHGCWRKLLEWGLQEADREGVECWIDSSPFGLGLHKKFG